MSNIQETIRRYEELDSKVGKLDAEVQREKVELEYDKKALKEKMEALKEDGLTFNNISELEKEMEDLNERLTEILDATEKQLNEAENI